jgi:hypothetical protein
MIEIPQQDSEKQKTSIATPDDRGVVHIDGYIKIFDPNTDVILVEARE